MNGWSPTGLPPSPAPKVMPGVVRSASTRAVEPVWLITSELITVTDFGRSSNGAVNLVDDALSTLTGLPTLPVTLISGSAAESAPEVCAQASWNNVGTVTLANSIAAMGVNRRSIGKSFRLYSHKNKNAVGWRI